jgi:hypothetical protein
MHILKAQDNLKAHNFIKFELMANFIFYKSNFLAI